MWGEGEGGILRRGGRRVREGEEGKEARQAVNGRGVPVAAWRGKEEREREREREREHAREREREE